MSTSEDRYACIKRHLEETGDFEVFTPNENQKFFPRFTIDYIPVISVKNQSLSLCTYYENNEVYIQRIMDEQDKCVTDEYSQDSAIQDVIQRIKTLIKEKCGDVK
ncbi:MAG: hypothetical protein ABIH76_05195 [Candidatus Bathyarchaeota archaeon]